MDYWNEDKQQAHNKLTEKYGRDFSTHKQNSKTQVKHREDNHKRREKNKDGSV